MIKKLFSESLVYGVGSQVPKFVNLLVLPLITPFLTPNDYGVYGILVAYITALTAFKSLGMSVVLSNSFFKYPDRYKFVWGKVFGFLILWSLFLSFIFALLIWLILPQSDLFNFVLVALCYSLPVALFDSTILIGTKYLQFSQKSKIYSLITVIASVIGIVVNYYTIVVLKAGYLGWVVSGFVISLVSFIGFAFFVFKVANIFPDFSISWNWLKRKLIIALPTIPHFYATYLITSADRVILDRYKVPLNEIGLYNLGYTFGGYFSLIGQSLGLALGPILYKQLKASQGDGESSIRNLSFLLQGGFILVGFLFGLWMKEIFQVVIRNEELVEAYKIAVLLVVSYTYYPMYFVINTKLQYYELTKYLWRITFVAAMLNLVLNLIFVPYMGIYATSLVTFVSLLFVGYGGYFYNFGGRKLFQNYKPILWIGLSIISLLSLNLIMDWLWYYKLVLTVLILGAVVFILFQRRKLLNEIIAR